MMVSTDFKRSEDSTKLVWVTIGIFVVSITMLIVIAARFASFFPDWTGLPAVETNAQGLDVPQGKTLWDWLDLLLVPLVVFIGGAFVNHSVKRNEAKLEERREQDATLQGYLHQITTLLLEMKLRASPPEAEVRSVARAYTLTVLSIVSGVRKGTVLQFLSEAGLIGHLVPVSNQQIVDLSGAALEEVYLAKGHLEGALLKGANLNKAHLRGAYLNKVELQGAYLEEACLNGAYLLFAHLERAHLQRARLIEAHLERAHLEGAHLEGAHLEGAHLEGAHLAGARLQGASLEGVDLTGARLSGANLTGANLRRANLTGANLTGSLLSGADLRDCNVTEQQLSVARSFKGAKLPFKIASSSTDKSAPDTKIDQETS